MVASNQQLQQNFKNKLEQDEVNRQGVVALAEVNEYIYKKMSKNDVSVKMTRDISSAFFGPAKDTFDFDYRDR